ncbi:MAG: hypothetical protein MUC43_03265 [Pirellula sp.]|nr:hypothetical protein [Pirellula sp.]
MKIKCTPARLGTSPFGFTDRFMVMRLALLIAALVSLPANTACAHPGHDHHAPQSGIMHWLLAPTHALPILGCLGLFVGFAIWKLRTTKRRSCAVDIDPGQN